MKPMSSADPSAPGAGPAVGGAGPVATPVPPLGAAPTDTGSNEEAVAARVPAGEPAAPPVIDLVGVTKVYATGRLSVAALRGVTIQIQRGEYVAIMGSSGSGKSTLMNILGCLDVPSTGRYRLDGVNVRRLNDTQLAAIRNRKIGFVFQSFNLIPRTTALHNVELPMIYAGLKPDERRARAKAALRVVGLAKRMDHLPNELSGGQQQRVAVARAIVTNPALILADEPTGNLDSVSSQEVLSVFDELNAQGRTVVLITHEQDVAVHAHRVVHLRDGQVLTDETRAQHDGRVGGAT
jgi:putative ABC transport system ATP-binding protein